MRTTYACLFCLTLLGATAAAGEAPRKTLMLLGDWPLQRLSVYASQGLLDRRLEALSDGKMQWQSFYAGVPGPVSYALGRPLAYGGHKPDFVLIAYGQLDLIQKEIAADSSLFEKNLRTLIATVEKDNPQARIILATAIPYARQAHTGRPDLDRPGGADAALDAQINRATRQVAQEKGLPLLDLHKLFHAYGGDALVGFGDRFPTLLGRRIVAEAVCQSVAQVARTGGSPDQRRPNAPAAAEIVTKPEPIAVGDGPRFAQLLLLGDSVTALSLGMATMTGQLEESLDKACQYKILWDVNNVGVGGESVPGALVRIQRVLDKGRANYITVSYGLNDMYFEARDEPQVFERNLRALLKAIQEHPSHPQLILLTCTPLHDTILGNTPHRKAMEAPHFRRGGPNKVLDTRINPITRRVAAETGLPLLDIHRHFMAGDLDKLISKDGVHPSKEGGDLLAKCVHSGVGQYVAARDLKLDAAVQAEARAKALLDEARALKSQDADKAMEKLRAAGDLCPYLAEVWALLDELAAPPTPQPPPPAPS